MTGGTGEARRATCCVIGCGPAGAMLSRENVSVREKHSDLLKDFREDTPHPSSTIEILDELCFADGLLRLPHTRAREIRGGRQARIIAFGTWPVHVGRKRRP